MERENQKKGMDLFVFLQGIWNKRFFIIKSICIGLVLGILIGYSIPKQFQAETRFMIDEEQEQRDQGMSIASLMGLNIKNISTGVPRDMYPEIAKSTDILIDLATINISLTREQEVSLFDYVINYQKEPWWNKVLDLPKIVKRWFVNTNDEFVQGAEWDKEHLSLNQQCFIDYLRKNIQVELNKENAIGNVRVTAQSAVVAAEIANNITRKLEKRISEIHHEKIKRELMLAQQMYENSEHEYKAMLERYAVNATKNRIEDYSPVKLDIAFNLYNMIARQYEIMKVNALTSEVSFEILQPAVASDIAIAPHKKKIIIGFMFVLGLLAVLWCLFKQAWEIDYKKDE